ncbi:hypothetical protein T11_13933 [Trichinella zimbabwensis]|uniref:Uncharacterized protein n=1 Tax=Trichinella zimbabwensis TaxID=268475 RepID=A0A0V1H348_9BILA|nr:hypothetical protein T11_13933 [Trichinella zimbabwensis]
MLHTDLFAAKHLFLWGACRRLMAYEDRLLCSSEQIFSINCHQPNRIASSLLMGKKDYELKCVTVAIKLQGTNCSRRVEFKQLGMVFLFCNWGIDAAAVAQLSVGRMISKSTTAIQKVRGIMI